MFRRIFTAFIKPRIVYVSPVWSLDIIRHRLAGEGPAAGSKDCTRSKRTEVKREDRSHYLAYDGRYEKEDIAYTFQLTMLEDTRRKTLFTTFNLLNRFDNVSIEQFLAMGRST